MPAALVVSDLHLAPTRPQGARHFADFLEGPAAKADVVYILGDLFEYWAGDDDLDNPFNATITAALKHLSDAGCRLYFVRGNRDFLVGDAFAAACGLILLEDPHLTDLAGQPTLFLHGDTLCTDDLAYQAFREQVRSRQWRDDFLALPLTERKRRIAALRRESEGEKRTKADAIMDVNADAVAATLRAHGYPRMIHGHTHRPGRHEHMVDGHRCERWVLGDWYGRGDYLHCDEHGCRALPWPPGAAG